ncbi:MAG: NAD(P)-dependent alcohol dehydrogenase [Gammaproteobacteria bacterium]|nr:NAD(P)-dependent alcohol dehydrogenase [Gammaproteobacteria bacterium]
MRGTPYVVRLGEGFGRPADPQIGVDFAGTVEAVGAAVTHFKIGDEVFGGRFGAFAEYVKVKESRGITLKPAEASFEQAAAVPIAGVTALQGLRDAGQLRAGQKVLVNGASGGVGTFAVQIAKSYGAKVTGVCSARNAQLVRSLGAEEVIDYAQGDFTQGTVRYDLIFDTVGTHSLADYARVLTPAGRVIIVGNAHLGDWLSAFITPLEGVVRSKFSRQQFLPVFAELTQADLTALASLMHSHQLISVIDRTLPFAQLPEGMRYLEAGHAHGKVIIEAP